MTCSLRVVLFHLRSTDFACILYYCLDLIHSINDLVVIGLIEQNIDMVVAASAATTGLQ